MNSRRRPQKKEERMQKTPPGCVFSSLPIEESRRKLWTEDLRNLPEIAMAKPHPPPQTSFQGSPLAGNGARTTAGWRMGERCGVAPGKYPHMRTDFSLDFSSIFSSPSPPLPAFMAGGGRRRGKTLKNQTPESLSVPERKR
ncbi:hypothetical protein ACLOJK_030103 [Asimina triloba]